MTDNYENCCKRPRAARVMKIIGIALSGIALAIGFALVFGYVVMLLWNWLMPLVFHLTVITYLQAVGIIILAKLLFGSFCGRGHGPKHDRFHKMHGFHGMGGMHGGRFMGGECNGDWKYYKDFWEKEGKEAFDTYIEKIKKKEK
jgi:hypothetical protein